MVGGFLAPEPVVNEERQDAESHQHPDKLDYMAERAESDGSGDPSKGHYQVDAHGMDAGIRATTLPPSTLPRTRFSVWLSHQRSAFIGVSSFGLPPRP
jgi:hypothetical protein